MTLDDLNMRSMEMIVAAGEARTALNRALDCIDDVEKYDELMEEEEETVAVAENTFKADFTQNVTVAPAPAKKERNVSLSSLPQLQVVLAKPEKFEEVRGIADNLNEKRTVVLNLESVSKEVASSFVRLIHGR